MMNEKYYLVFWEGDGGDRESCSVFYSSLVKAVSLEEAKTKYASKNNCSDDDMKGMGTLELELIE